MKKQRSRKEKEKRRIWFGEKKNPKKPFTTADLLKNLAIHK